MNEGSRRVLGHRDEGKPVDCLYAVADVTVPLDSVSQICDAGNTVVFTAKGGWIIGKAGRVDFFRDKDTYQRRTWIRRKSPLKPSKSPGKTTTTAVKRVSVQPPSSARDADDDDNDDKDEEDVEVNAMTVLAATRPLDFQRQGRSP